MIPQDKIYTPKQKEPEREHFIIFSEGIYYKNDMPSYHRFIALYGLPSWKWSYTNHQATKTYGRWK